VVGSDSGKRYRISKGRVFNVQELDPCVVQVRSWCFMADGIATGDVNLAQKIALEAFETKVLAVANRSEGSVRPAAACPQRQRHRRPGGAGNVKGVEAHRGRQVASSDCSSGQLAPARLDPP
jgi:hypothetical protein